MGQLSNGQLSKARSMASGRAHPRPRNGGVSLIEVMIALAVLGFGMLGVAAIQISALRSTDQSRERTLAQGLAQQQIEIFQEMSDASLQASVGANVADPANPIDPDPNDAQQMFFNRSWTITPDTPENDVYTIVVTVGWNNANGAARQVQLETFKSEF